MSKEFGKQLYNRIRSGSLPETEISFHYDTMFVAMPPDGYIKGIHYLTWNGDRLGGITYGTFVDRSDTLWCDISAAMVCFNQNPEQCKGYWLDDQTIALHMFQEPIKHRACLGLYIVRMVNGSWLPLNPIDAELYYRQWEEEHLS
jgi:hypothetical protein